MSELDGSGLTRCGFPDDVRPQLAQVTLMDSIRELIFACKISHNRGGGLDAATTAAGSLHERWEHSTFTLGLRTAVWANRRLLKDFAISRLRELGIES